jgi:hypothetical protein
LSKLLFLDILSEGYFEVMIKVTKKRTNEIENYIQNVRLNDDLVVRLWRHNSFTSEAQMKYDLYTFQGNTYPLPTNTYPMARRNCKPPGKYSGPVVTETDRFFVTLVAKGFFKDNDYPPFIGVMSYNDDVAFPG